MFTLCMYLFGINDSDSVKWEYVELSMPIYIPPLSLATRNIYTNNYILFMNRSSLRGELNPFITLVLIIVYLIVYLRNGPKIHVLE